MAASQQQSVPDNKLTAKLRTRASKAEDRALKAEKQAWELRESLRRLQAGQAAAPAPAPVEGADASDAWLAALDQRTREVAESVAGHQAAGAHAREVALKGQLAAAQASAAAAQPGTGAGADEGGAIHAAALAARAEAWQEAASLAAEAARVVAQSGDDAAALGSSAQEVAVRWNEAKQAAQSGAGQAPSLEDALLAMRVAGARQRVRALEARAAREREEAGREVAAAAAALRARLSEGDSGSDELPHPSRVAGALIPLPEGVLSRAEADRVVEELERASGGQGATHAAEEGQEAAPAVEVVLRAALTRVHAALESAQAAAAAQTQAPDKAAAAPEPSPPRSSEAGSTASGGAARPSAARSCQTEWSVDPWVEAPASAMQAVTEGRAVGVEAQRRQLEREAQEAEEASRELLESKGPVDGAKARSQIATLQRQLGEAVRELMKLEESERARAEAEAAARAAQAQAEHLERQVHELTEGALLFASLVRDEGFLGGARAVVEADDEVERAGTAVRQPAAANAKVGGVTRQRLVRPLANFEKRLRRAKARWEGARTARIRDIAAAASITAGEVDTSALCPLCLRDPTAQAGPPAARPVPEPDAKRGQSQGQGPGQASRRPGKRALQRGGPPSQAGSGADAMSLGGVGRKGSLKSILKRAAGSSSGWASGSARGEGATPGPSPAPSDRGSATPSESGVRFPSLPRTATPRAKGEAAGSGQGTSLPPVDRAPAPTADAADTLVDAAPSPDVPVREVYDEYYDEEQQEQEQEQGGNHFAPPHGVTAAHVRAVEEAATRLSSAGSGAEAALLREVAALLGRGDGLTGPSRRDSKHAAASSYGPSGGASTGASAQGSSHQPLPRESDNGAHAFFRASPGSSSPLEGSDQPGQRRALDAREMHTPGGFGEWEGSVGSRGSARGERDREHLALTGPASRAAGSWWQGGGQSPVAAAAGVEPGGSARGISQRAGARGPETRHRPRGKRPWWTSHGAGASAGGGDRAGRGKAGGAGGRLATSRTRAATGPRLHGSHSAMDVRGDAFGSAVEGSHSPRRRGTRGARAARGTAHGRMTTTAADAIQTERVQVPIPRYTIDFSGLERLPSHHRAGQIRRERAALLAQLQMLREAEQATLGASAGESSPGPRARGVVPVRTWPQPLDGLPGDDGPPPSLRGMPPSRLLIGLQQRRAQPAPTSAHV